MSEYLKLVGTIVVGVEGVTGATRHIGEAIGVQTQPTVLIRKQFGEIEHWAESLVRPATRDEELEYWKARALAADSVPHSVMTAPGGMSIQQLRDRDALVAAYRRKG